MNIHFDLVHPADVNLFSFAIHKLHEEGHAIFITLRERGKLSTIAAKELGSFEIIHIGKHEKTFAKKLFALVKRELDLFRYLRNNKIQISVNQSFSSVFSCKLLGIPFLNFEDDYEYKLAFHYARLFSSRDIMPDFILAKGKNIYKYHGFKELAYLHPAIFKPDNEVPGNLGVIPYKYVFIREIANISLNYTTRKSYLEKVVELITSLGLQIILSLEDKSISKKFEDHCIILQEPVADIYSLISHSLFTVSSGDTMAREACLLGTPTIYSGGRDMLMNTPLIEKGILFKADTVEAIDDRIKYLMSNNNAFLIRSKAKKIITGEWENTTDVIIKHINEATSGSKC